MKQLQQNLVSVDLSTGQTLFGSIDISNEVIDASATILANLLLDYVRNGGSTTELTPSNVFGKGELNE